MFTELKKVHPSHHQFVRRDIKADLIKHGNEILKKADEAIKKLQAQHKTVELNKILSEESEVKKLIAELEAAKDTSKITHLEHDLKIAESRLNYEVMKVNLYLATLLNKLFIDFSCEKSIIPLHTTTT